MSDFQQTITSLNLLHTSLCRMELFTNAQAVKNAKTDVISLISRLESLERERDELRAEQAEHDEQIARMESKFSLAKRALDSKTARCEKAEAELRRRDAAAGEVSCQHKWINSQGRTESGWLCEKCGDYERPIAAPPALLPPDITFESKGFVSLTSEDFAYNRALEDARKLGAQQQKVVELPERETEQVVGWGEWDAFDADATIAALDAAGVKWEVKK